MTEYKYLSGVIINRNTGDYLYCVVGELGPRKNGMGEVSIYSAWKILMYKKSAPAKSNKGSTRYGWKYKDAYQLRKQIVKVGKQFYKGGRRGRCLN